MKFIKLSLCLILAGSFFGICASEESFELLPTIENRNLEALQAKYDSLNAALLEFRTRIRLSSPETHDALLRFECKNNLKYLESTLVQSIIVDGAGNQYKLDEFKEEYKYYQKKCHTYCYCCPHLILFSPVKLYVLQLEDEAKNALKSLEISMEERA